MEEYDISCPYCGETIGLLIDCSLENQQYIEDCQVCCSPILLTVTATADGQLDNVDAVQEND